MPPQVPAGAAYSLFMLLGNDKLPFLAGVGHVNFYMWCAGWAGAWAVRGRLGGPTVHAAAVGGG